MKILLFTNVYAPREGPSAELIGALVHELRRKDHEVVVMTPRFDAVSAEDEDEAIVRFPVDRVTECRSVVRYGELPTGFFPDLVHSFDPFLAGELAFRFATENSLPLVFSPSLVFTHLSGEVPHFEELSVGWIDSLATRYAMASDLVLAHSESILTELSRRRTRPYPRVVDLGVDPFWIAREDTSETLPPGASVREPVLGVLHVLFEEPWRRKTLQLFEKLAELPNPPTIRIAGELPEGFEHGALGIGPELIGKVRSLKPRTRIAQKSFLRSVDILLAPPSSGHAFTWEGPARAAGASYASFERLETVLDAVRYLEQETAEVAATRRRANSNSVASMVDSLPLLERLYGNLVLRGSPKDRSVMMDLAPKLAALSEEAMRLCEQLDLRSMS